jgi:hypothetical protein
VAVRSHEGGELGTMGMAEFAERVHSEERQAEDGS